jgi:EAL domain-containing protein (putative c-di-GMP-specific phosphodiesterase class I)
MGADEFVIVISRITNLWDAAHIAKRMLDSVQKNIDIGGTLYSVSASIGIAISPDDGRDEADLIRKADMAMYHAKSEGRNNFQYYKDDMNKKAVSQLDMERRLKLATKNGEFQLYYQPQVSITDGSIIGVEALLRWPSKDGGMIPPLDFIPLAEESGLMPDIGIWVLKQACRDAVLLSEDLHNIKMAVNLSVGQFKDSELLLTALKKVLAETGLHPGQLQMEITESMLIEDVDTAIATMNSFRELGVSLAIDDFGTGYSSLNYLTLFPVDCLKIDKSFVSNMMNNRNDSTLTSAIISLGHNLGMSVLAEGVETSSQLEKLQVLGCDNYQGYFFARPMPLVEVKALILASRNRNMSAG